MLYKFQNLSGVKWDCHFMFNGLVGHFYTPWFGIGYNIHPNHLKYQVWNALLDTIRFKV